MAVSDIGWQSISTNTATQWWHVEKAVISTLISQLLHLYITSSTTWKYRNSYSFIVAFIGRTEVTITRQALTKITSLDISSLLRWSCYLAVCYSHYYPLVQLDYEWSNTGYSHSPISVGLNHQYGRGDGKEKWTEERGLQLDLLLFRWGDVSRAPILCSEPSYASDI